MENAEIKGKTEVRKRMALTISPSEELIEALMTKHRPHGRTEYVNLVFHRYKTMLQEHFVALTAAEAQVLTRICEDSVIDDNFVRYLNQHMPAEVEPELQEAAKSLTEKILQSDYSSRVSMIARLGY